MSDNNTAHNESSLGSSRVVYKETNGQTVPPSLPPSLPPLPSFPPSFLLSTESEELLSQVRSARTYHVAISPDLIHLVVATQNNHLLLVNLPDYFQVRGVGKGGREGGKEGVGEGG